MKSDYFAVNRKLIKSDLWLSEPFTRGQAWVDLIGLAQWHEEGFIRKRGNRVDLKRGQCGWSQAKLAERWKWSRGKVKRFLNELETELQIEQLNTTICSVITIINYDKYQPNGTTDKATDGQQTDSRRTADGQQTDTNKKLKEGLEGKEGKKESKKNNIKKNLAQKPDDVTDQTWADFQTLRKAKKAPLTVKALEGIQREAEKACWRLEDVLDECCARGWQGFKAEWVTKEAEDINWHVPHSYAKPLEDKNAD